MTREELTSKANSDRKKKHWPQTENADKRRSKSDFRLQLSRKGGVLTTPGGGGRGRLIAAVRHVSFPAHFQSLQQDADRFWILTTNNVIMGAVRWKCPLSTVEYDQLGSGPWAKPDQMAAPRSLKREKLTKRPVIPSIIISLPFFLAFWSMDWGCACGQSDQERWSRVERIPSVFSKNYYLAKVVWCAVENGRSQRIAPSITPFSSFKISLTKYGYEKHRRKTF